MQRLRRAVERVSGREWVEGEVAGVKRAASGHVYFSLKDEREDAVVDCVMYRFQAQRARRHLFDGRRLQLLGRATVWAPRGRLQFIAEAARPAGLGALLAQLEELKEKLRLEGFFDAARKRTLPAEPKVVGLVTSASGAALHDVVSVAFRRGAVRIVLCPALVQGDGAAGSIIRAIDRIERYPGLDCLIVGRGGGSGEDLMAFNDERVVRRVAKVRVPVVSAVGHEVDTTLTDLVADVRAATPSQAAELVVPDQVARAQALQALERQLVRAIGSRLREDRATADRLRAKLSDPRFVLAEKQQYLDEFLYRAERAARRAIGVPRTRLETLRPRLMARHPRAVVARAEARLQPLTARLGAATMAELRDARHLVSELSKQLQALSPLAVLARGYSIALREDGRAVRRPADVSRGDRLRLRLAEGQISAVVDDPGRGQE